MTRARSTRVKLTTAAIFILLEVAAVAILHSSSSLQNIWLNRASHRVIGFVWGSSEHISNYFSLRKQNEYLAGENFLLQEELRAYRSMSEKALMKELSGTPEPGFAYIPAKIVKMSLGTQNNYVILDKGSADGIKPDTGIITGHGVVGVVKAVDTHLSYGLTLMNTAMTVSARIGRDGVVAPLQWDGKHSNRAVLKNLPLDFPASPGDTVWTSGHSVLFPSDIPIGLTGRRFSESGASENIEVTLLQDLSSLKYVTVVEHLHSDSMEELEKTGGRQ